MDEFERMRGQADPASLRPFSGQQPQSNFARTISRVAQAPVKFAKRLLPPKSSLIDKSKPYFSGISRFGVSKIASFWKDPFHTLLNMPWGTFIMLFFSTYIMLYLVFAWLYWLQGNCIVDPTVGRPSFSHALWMSSRVASTLGFDVVHPNADCSFINFCVMMQVIASSLINFIMLGVVFARFSAPFKRASTVRFSKVAAISRHPSGYWALTFRVANLRKHQILQPSVRLVVTAVDSITPSFYHHEQLTIEGAYKQLTNLELGFPAHISHVITPDSFLYNLSLLEMDTRMMEILVFVDGIDAMTSKYMSARIAYATSDVYMNEMFAPMNLEMRGRSLGLNFNDFDKTLPALDPSLLLDLPDASTYRGGQGATGLWQLRHQTFKKLAERYVHLGVTDTGFGVPGRVSEAGNISTGLTITTTTTTPTAIPVPDVNHASSSKDVPIIPAQAVPAEVVVVSSSPLASSTVPPSPGPFDPHQQHVSLLGPDSTPSHVTTSIKGMSLSTSGMPFAVARAAGQEKEGGLAGLFGVQKPHPTPTGGAWVSAHSEWHIGEANGTHPAAGAEHKAGTPSAGGGSGGDTFVPLVTIQRSQGGTGTAWQQSGIPLPPPSTTLTGRPSGGGVPGSSPNSGSPTYAGTSGVVTPPLASPLLQPGLYTLTEDIDTSPSKAAAAAAAAAAGNLFASPTHGGSGSAQATHPLHLPMSHNAQ